MKKKLLYSILTIISILLFNACKQIQLNEASVVSKKEDFKIPTHKFRDPYTYHQQAIIKPNKLEKEELQSSVYASAEEQISIPTNNFYNQSSKPQYLDNEMELSSNKKVLKRYRKIKKSAKDTTDAASAASIVLFVLGIVGSILGMFIGIVGSIFNPAYIYVFGAALVTFMGTIIGFVIFQSSLKKQRAEEQARVEALKQEQLKKTETTNSKETPNKETKTMVDKLRDLKKLHDEGLIDDAEFKKLKTKILEEN